MHIRIFDGLGIFIGEKMAQDMEKTNEFKKGLEGVVAGDSRICLVNGEEGKLYYRGYRIEDLAQNCSFEEVAYLMLYSKLPNKKELAKFSKGLAKARKLPKEVIKIIKLKAKSANSMEVLRTAVSALAANQPEVDKLTKDEQIGAGISLIAKMPVIIAFCNRLKKDMEIVKPDPKLGHAANFLYMLYGRTPSETETKGMDMDFVLHAEHSFNASTFSVRITVSTLSDMYSAFTTGIGVLKGPLHGGAAQEVGAMMLDIKNPANTDGYINNILSQHGKVMGFGHRIYKTYDPRARILNGMARKMSEEKKDMAWYDIAQKIERIMQEKKNLYPNVDFYSAIVYKQLGIEMEMNPAIFAIGRSAGWVAHVMEQYGDNRLIRPLDNYIGDIGLKFVPIDSRK